MKGRKALWSPFGSQWAHHWCCFRSRLCPCFAWILTIGPRCNWSGHLWTAHQISCSYQLQHHIFPSDSPPWWLCVYGMDQLWKNKRSFKTHPTTTRVVLCMLGQVGFLKLIQKEWCSFGHRFRTRLASHWHVGHVKLVIDRPVGSGRRTDWFQLFVQKDIIYRSMDLTFYFGILLKDAVLWQTNLSLSTKWWM